MRIARRLVDVPGLTVVTNSPRVADVLHEAGRADQTIILTGGVRTPSDALVGPFAVAALRSVHLDLVFMGVHGMDARPGSRRPNLLEAETDRALVEAGRRLVVVADHTKWGVVGISSIARLDQADVLITDGHLDAAARAILAGRCASWSRPARPNRVHPPAGRSSPSRRCRGAISDPFPPGRPGWPNVAEAPSAPPGTDAARAPAPTRDTADLLTQPHRRYNPLTDEWILVSTDRIQRPLQGRSRDARRPIHRVAYDPGCYLCPGNVRASGEWNPAYGETFVFTNDYAALRPDTSDARLELGLLRAEGERGTCRVICFSPRHDLTMARMSPRAPCARSSTSGRSRRPSSASVSAGSRSLKTGARRWARRTPIPTARSGPVARYPARPPARDAAAAAPLGSRRYGPLLDYVAQETGGRRVMAENADWLVVVPFWAAWPFETLVLPKRPVHA